MIHLFTWEQRKFEDVGYISMCKRIFKNETSEQGDVPFYKIGTFGEVADAYISREKYETYKTKFSYPNKGDILLSASGTIGRIVEYSGEKAYYQDSNIIWLNHNKLIVNKFLKVLYPTIKWDGIEGSTIKRLYNSNFLSTKFMMPKTEEQEQIGTLFGHIDNLITLHQRKYGYEYVCNKNYTRYYNITWEQRKLKEISNIQAGGDIDSSQIKECGKYPVIANALTNDGIVGYYEGYYRIKAPAVTVTGRGDVGHAQARKVNFTPVVRLLALNTKHDVDFISSVINTKRIIVESTGVPQLTVPQLENYEVFITSEKEESEIGRLFVNLDNLITLHQHKYNM